MPKKRAPRNRTLELTATEQKQVSKQLVTLGRATSIPDVLGKTIHQDMRESLDHLPDGFVNLLILDPPYNLAKSFNGKTFRKLDVCAYSEWIAQWFCPLLRLLRKDASIYFCGDWLTSVSIYEILASHVRVRNRITWEREKGRGAKMNWKNCSEDIWFATVSDDYHFDANAVRLKRKVIAPYREVGKPKDWREEEHGNFRLTSPSNLWSDITVPFWSMPENTDHPTQKPEKLFAKLILASSRARDVVFDPFVGSGTTSVVAKKLGRHYVGIEIDNMYCCLTEKRLQLAESSGDIQGFADGVFWERNTLQQQGRSIRKLSTPDLQENLFAAS